MASMILQPDHHIEQEHLLEMEAKNHNNNADNPAWWELSSL